MELVHLEPRSGEVPDSGRSLLVLPSCVELALLDP
jgi:hypothetical protein